MTPCPHRRVEEIGTQIVREPGPRAIQAMGFCLDCQRHVQRLTAPVAFGPWSACAPEHFRRAREGTSGGQRHGPRRSDAA